MPIRAELYNGQALEFPDNTPPETIQRVVKEQTIKAKVAADDAKWRASIDPTEGMSGMDKFLAGTGKAFADIGRGVSQVFGADNQQEIDDAKRRDAALMDTGAGMAGNLLGNAAAFAPTAFVPGANTYTGAALIGAGMGALTPTASDESRLTNMATGAGFGVGGKALAGALSRTLSPRTSQEVVGLMDEGVTPTPGRILGGAFRKAEDAAESVPFLGEGIKGAKVRANDQFNKAALNRVLAPLGKQVDDIGHEGVTQARRLVSESYDDALGKLLKVDIDQTFDDALTNIRSMATTLPDSQQKQFEKILQTDLFGKMTPARTASGESYKTIVSQLDKKARGYLKSQDFDQQQLGDALQAVSGELKRLAGRTNPAAQQAISKADKAYAQLLRIENAAARQGSQEGKFSPAQLAAAVRQMDPSLRKVQSSQGKALLQDFAQQGRSVLGDTLPNSGTADRLMNALMLGGGYALNPALAVGTVAARGMYTKPGQAALAAALAKRPEIARQAGRVVQRAAPVGTLIGASEGLQQ